MANPYRGLPLHAFWRTGVAESDPARLDGIYTKKWVLAPGDGIATAGSCFARHLSRRLKDRGFKVLDVEPPPKTVPAEAHAAHGYGLYSARYGNIYTMHQLLQLAKEAAGAFAPAEIVWEKDGRFYDALRPGVEPSGMPSPEMVSESRARHLDRVRQLFAEMDLLVFTLGLTEAWTHRETGTVFPTAPEITAGRFEPAKYELRNYGFQEIVEAFYEFQRVVKGIRQDDKDFRVLLTVSPVPLTATASGNHVLPASTYSKSVLRAAAGQLATDQPQIDYFPSFEIVTNQAARGAFFDINLRTVTAEGVQAVMNAFFRQHSPPEATLHTRRAKEANTSSPTRMENDPDCDEALLEAFIPSKRHPRPLDTSKLIVFIGDSHLGNVKNCMEQYFSGTYSHESLFIPANWMTAQWNEFEKNDFLTHIEMRETILSSQRVERIPTKSEMSAGITLCLVGLGMLGDGLVRAHGPLTAGRPGLEEGRSISPNMPLFSEDLIHGNLDFLKQQPAWRKYRALYDEYLSGLIESFVQLNESRSFKRIYWIAGPNMTEFVARFRLGDEYVDSLSHRVHTQMGRSCVEEFLVDLDPDGWLITHSRDLETATGFTKNEYANNPGVPYDIHTNAAFYKQAIEVLLGSAFN